MHETCQVPTMLNQSHFRLAYSAARTTELFADQLSSHCDSIPNYSGGCELFLCYAIALTICARVF